jgi:hypothetical protein
MNITAAELETLEVIGGVLVYTVDENEIVEVVGGEAGEPTKSTVTAPVGTPEPTEQSTTTVEVTEKVPEVVVAVKPAIVKPVPRTAKK